MGSVGQKQLNIGRGEVERNVEHLETSGWRGDANAAIGLGDTLSAASE